MSGEKEPGLMDVISEFLKEGPEEGYRCDTCNNGKATISARCPCGWKFQGCLACLLIDASKNTYAMADAFKEHKRECEPLIRLVRMAEVAGGLGG
jgi:hypothetical protein